MTTPNEPALTSSPVTMQVSEPAAVAWAPGPGHAYPATAPGVPFLAESAGQPADLAIRAVAWSRMSGLVAKFSRA
jgi:hypothetical protein